MQDTKSGHSPVEIYGLRLLKMTSKHSFTDEYNPYRS